MLLQHMAKKVSLIFCFIILLTDLVAQHKQANSFSYKEFITTGTLKINSNYFLVFSRQSVLQPLLQSGSISIARQLNDTAFIIIKNDNTVLDFTPIFPANTNWKLSPALLQKEKNNWSLSLLIVANKEINLSDPAYSEKFSWQHTYIKNNFIVSIKNKSGFEDLLNHDAIIFISEYNRQPKEELQINSLDLSANKINLLHSKLPALNGSGLTVSIKENKPDTTDIDLAGRYIPNALSSTNISSHASTMATMAAGAGNSYYLGKGVAVAAAITSSNFSNLLPDASLNYTQHNITVQNHSYGVGIENFYGADAAAFDASAITNDKLVFVFSAGNSGTATTTTGNYAGIAGVANLTGSFKMAKNIITVGAIDSLGNVVGPSSKGPAYDGRIKPEMVAYGEDGSSGAAALVSGTALVLQQAYKNNTAGALPSSALVKAVLLNSCDDVAANGIDFTSGFGSLNAYKAAEGMSTQKYFTGAVSNNSAQTFTIAIPPNISKAKCTLVWNDAPANANDFKAVKNDLDLQLKSTASSQVWLPWVLNSFAHKDSLSLLPVRKRDSLNTIEQVSIDNPVAGNYTVTVNGFNVSTGSQPFAIAYQFDTANVFQWTFPTATDNIFPAAANVIRWADTYGNVSASLHYSINNGISWQPVAGTINLGAKYFRWTAPDTTAIALLRMTIGSQQFTSDPFSISAKPALSIGFNCADSVLLYWSKNKGISNYQLYGMGTKYLQPVSSVADTQYIFDKYTLPYTIFAVAPIINSQPGVKSYATDYATQGVDCYVKNLLADLVNNTGIIQLSIGTTYQIKKIVFEKNKGGNFSSISEFSNINGLNYTATDINLQKGINSYRVAIYLMNGKIIYSDIVSVIYFYDSEVLIYPNPVLQNSTITLQLKALKNQVVTITDAAGRKVWQKKLSSTVYSFPAFFAKGFYIISILEEDNTQQCVKLLIL